MDEQGSTSRWNGIDSAACHRYVVSCQTRQGGFCFYTYPQWGVEEPNPPDTCAAIESLALLGEDVPAVRSCIAWLQAQQSSAGGYATLTIAYATLKALKRLDAAPLKNPERYLHNLLQIHGLVEPLVRTRSGWLRDALRCTELFELYGLTLPDSVREGMGTSLERLRKEDGGYGEPGSNLPDTATALVLAAGVHAAIPLEILAYAKRCESRPYGFNITPLSISSSLETQRAGLEIFRHFGQCPKEPALMRRYISSCQSAQGGFGRVPGAISRLDDSLRALQALATLRKMEREPRAGAH